MREIDQLNFLPEPRPPVNLKRRSTKRSIFFGILIIGILILAGCITYAALPVGITDNPDAYDPVTLEPKTPEGFLKRLKHFVFNKDVVLAGEKKDRINILLLGMGGIGHDGPFLTDTIIIASIKPSTKELAMISIPRDLAVDIPDYGVKKINFANSAGETQKSNWGAAFATEVIENTFDIDIQYYVRMDFKAFEEVINEVDGLSINVDTSFTDPMYPAPNDQYQTVSFASGVQTMNGQKALQYARSRHGSNGEGSDFARAERQQKVLLALKEKVLSFKTLANPIKIHSIVESLDQHITTNMEFSDIIALFKLMRELNTDNLTRLVLDTSPNGYLQNGYSSIGAFILTPKTGNFEEINAVIENIFNEDFVVKNDTPEQNNPALTPANIEIQNGTWRGGLAARMQKRLEDRGFVVATIGNTVARPQMKSGIFSTTDKYVQDTLQELENELHIPIKEKPSEEIAATSTTDILIILGEDMEE